jgi:hypothetical protein
MSQKLSELQRQLEEQIELLRLVCANFDAGHEVAAKHIAVSVRVLVHDTRQSHSLLSQLGLKDRDFVDTAHRFDPENLLPYHGLIAVSLGAGGTRYIAPLDQGRTRNLLPFAAWWSATIFASQPVEPPAERLTISRKDLVLDLANKAGGAHVDPDLPDRFRRLARENVLQWRTRDDFKTWTDLPGPENAAVRQIGHEILATFDARYHPAERTAPAFEIAGAALLFATDEEVAEHKRIRAMQLRRNAPCPCDSGKRFKHCHGRL